MWLLRAVYLIQNIGLLHSVTPRRVSRNSRHAVVVVFAGLQLTDQEIIFRYHPSLSRVRAYTVDVINVCNIYQKNIKLACFFVTYIVLTNVT